MASSLRILIVSQYFWPESFRINELVQSLVSKGLSVEVVTGKPNYPGGTVFDGYSAGGISKEKYGGVDVHRIPLIPRRKGAVALTMNYASFVISGLLFAPLILRKKRFDLIFVYAPSPILQAIPAILLGRLKSCPTLLWVQDLWPESLSSTGYVTQPSLLKVVERAVRWIYQRVDLLLVPSRAFTPRVAALAGSTPVVYYPNSFIDERPVQTSEVMGLPLLKFDFTIVFAGNIGAAQAVKVVLEAATLLRSLEGIGFVIVGDGSQRDWLVQQVAERQLNNIVFPGRYPVEAMPSILGKAGALLVTLADTEIFRVTIPSKIQAYLAAGRPIIACLNGAGADIVMEAGAGVAVPAEDPLSLAEAVKHLYELPEIERLEMGNRGRAYYEEHFSHDKLVDVLIGYFEQSVRSHKGFKQ